MSLQDKYRELIDAAQNGNVSNLNVREQNNVLYINGSASGDVKKRLWDVYNRIDPDYRSGDVVMNINAGAPSGGEARVTTKESNLNIRKAPSTEAQVVGKAAHGSVVTIVDSSDAQWSYVRTAEGIEGYAFNQYLTKM